LPKINIGNRIRQVYEGDSKASVNISAAQEAVYERTSWLIGEYFGLKDIQTIVDAGAWHEFAWIDVGTTGCKVALFSLQG